MHKNILQKIFSIQIIAILTIFFTYMNSYALPSIEEFKIMCEDKNRISQFNNLNLMLSKANQKDKLRWICNFNETYDSPLVYAVNSDNLLLAKVIIRHSIQNHIDYNKFTMKNGTSMLTIAARKNDYNAVDFLLNYHHPIKMDLGINFSSPIHEAAKHQNTMLFFTLYKKHNNINLIHRKDNNNFTPINYLINSQKELLVIEILNTFPINLRHIPKDSKNMTYLHHAINHKMYKLSKILLEQGLDPNQTSDFGTAIDIANKYQYSNFIILIKQHNYIQEEKKTTKKISILASNARALLNCCGLYKDSYEPIK